MALIGVLAFGEDVLTFCDDALTYSDGVLTSSNGALALATTLSGVLTFSDDI